MPGQRLRLSSSDECMRPTPEATSSPDNRPSVSRADVRNVPNGDIAISK
jgi:hypothetical protein